MNYTKPELAVLGDANVMIQGSKDKILDGAVSPGTAAAETIE
ncbi:MAG: hypothetical protein JWO91_20 [Acidobacteriaceae bacterium]|jgi:hypothetical protein|nr:hypothetical protein [Acidobacteriaceae bacterium]